MNMKVFQRMLDTYGANIDRWPDPVLREAIDLTVRSVQAREALRRAKEIDDLLGVCVPQIDEDRLDRLVRAVGTRQNALPVTGSVSPSVIRFWQGWLGRPAVSAIYVAVFILGGVFNLILRLSAAAAPLDFLFPGNLLSPLGG